MQLLVKIAAVIAAAGAVLVLGLAEPASAAKPIGATGAQATQPAKPKPGKPDKSDKATKPKPEPTEAGVLDVPDPPPGETAGRWFGCSVVATAITAAIWAAGYWYIARWAKAGLTVRGWFGSVKFEPWALQAIVNAFSWGTINAVTRRVIRC